MPEPLPPELSQEIKRTADALKAKFTPPEFIPGCEVKSISDINQYATNNGWIEAVCGQHNQQRVRYKGYPASVGTTSYVDVLYFRDRRLFEVYGSGGTAVPPVLSGSGAAGVFAYFDGELSLADAAGVTYDSNKIVLTGSSRVAKEIIRGAAGTPKGASAPTEALRAIGASGGVQVDVYQFSQVTQQDAYVEFHAPDDIDASVDVSLALMWLPGTGWTGGNYVWTAEYLIKGEGDAYNTGTPTTITADVTPSNATDWIETTFSTAITMVADDVLLVHFYRDVASDNGDDTGDVTHWELKYTANKLGG